MFYVLSFVNYDEYENQLQIAESSRLDIVLMGDFNIEYIYPDQYKNSKWSKLVKDFCLHQLVDKPTRVTHTSSTIIDHIYTTCPSKVRDIMVPCVALSDHFPITLTLGQKYFQYNAATHNTIKYRSFTKFNETDFLNDLSLIDFNIVETVEDPSAALNLLYDLLNIPLDKHAPIKIKKSKAT